MVDGSQLITVWTPAGVGPGVGSLGRLLAARDIEPPALLRAEPAIWALWAASLGRAGAVVTAAFIALAVALALWPRLDPEAARIARLQVSAAGAGPAPARRVVRGADRAPRVTGGRRRARDDGRAGPQRIVAAAPLALASRGGLRHAHRGPAIGRTAPAAAAMGRPLSRWGWWRLNSRPARRPAALIAASSSGPAGHELAWALDPDRAPTWPTRSPGSPPGS